MTTIDRPSDEMAGKVVAEWKGWNECEGPRWCGTHNAFQNTHEPYDFCKDPRDDLDAAMELLWHLEMKLRPTHSIRKGEGWIAGGEYGDGVQEWIPRSGPGLRYGIVRIVAEVMGVGG